MGIETVLRVCSDLKDGLQPCKFIPSESIIHGDPREHGADVHSSLDGRFNIGVWECTPYTEVFDGEGYPSDEFCTIVSGRVSLTDEKGKSKIFSAGESFFIPKGFRGMFRVIETVKKYYVTYSS